MSEPAFIDALRALATDPAARGLADDVAVLGDLVLTHDMIVEGVHYLPDDPPADVAWKLLAVNLSDLAAKGATPIGCLMGYMLGGDGDWDTRFVAGLAEALAAFDLPLLGGDTVSAPRGVSRVLGLTAIGRAPVGGVPARSGARPGDGLWVTGAIGAAGLGLERARAGAATDDPYVAAYRRPVPRLAEGRALAPHVTAMMDVSDGLLIDAARLAAASGSAVAIDLGAVPIAGSPAGRDAILAAVTAGDDYQLLFTLPGGRPPPVLATPARRIGRITRGTGLSLSLAGKAVPLPGRLGYLHGGERDLNG